MKTIETNAVVNTTGTLIIQLQTDISAGTHPVVLVINPQEQLSKHAESLRFEGTIRKPPTFNWEDGLSELKSEYNGVSLQKKSLEWR